MEENSPHQKVVSSLLKQIFKGELKPGQKLPSLRALSEQMKVDNASMRIALKNLEAMNLLDIRRSDGAYIRDYMQDAGLDFLSAIFRFQEADSGETLVDKYLVDEVWEFWIAFMPEVIRMAARKFSSRDIRELMNIMDQELASIHDPDRLIELEVSLQDRIAAVANNIVVLLWFNSTRPLRKKMMEMYVLSLSAEEMDIYIQTRRQMLDSYLIGDTRDLDLGIDRFREMLQQIRMIFRQSQLEKNQRDND